MSDAVRSENMLLRYDVLCALDDRAQRNHVSGYARGAEWSTLQELAEYLDAGEDLVRDALRDATASEHAEEHPDWLGCFRLTSAGRAQVQRELFGAD